MSIDALGRTGSPVSEHVWEALDKTMVGAATSQLTGRRLLDVRGPYGLGLKSVALPDEDAGDGLIVSGTVPLALIQRSFTLSARDLAAYEHESTSLDLAPLAEAAIEVARREDEVVFAGTRRAPGLTTIEGVASVPLPAWDALGSAVGTVIAAATRLDENGFHGPYALAVSPARYNLLLRRLETGVVSELDTIREIATDGVFKAPVLDDAGVLIAVGAQFAHIVVGQDMSLGFVGPTADGRFEFTISESLAVRVLERGAVCVIGKPAAGATNQGDGARRRRQA
jgi:uncharacterized linocin/CFP29 family protein